MSNLSILLLLLLSSHYLTAKSQDETSSNPKDFIKESCNSTLYPTLCFQCLSTYAKSIQPPGQEKQLAEAALQVSLSRARSAANYVSKLSTFRGSQPREYQAVKDCFDTLGDSVYELNQSLEELSGISRIPVANPSFSWHVSNVETWVSAALTDDTTCVDGFSSSGFVDGNMKENIKERVNDVAKVTSIALAMVTLFADGGQGVALTSNP